MALNNFMLSSMRICLPLSSSTWRVLSSSQKLKIEKTDIESLQHSGKTSILQPSLWAQYSSKVLQRMANPKYRGEITEAQASKLGCKLVGLNRCLLICEIL